MMIIKDVGVLRGIWRKDQTGHKNVARNPVSNSWDSHPAKPNKLDMFTLFAYVPSPFDIYFPKQIRISTDSKDVSAWNTLKYVHNDYKWCLHHQDNSQRKSNDHKLISKQRIHQINLYYYRLLFLFILVFLKRGKVLWSCCVHCMFINSYSFILLSELILHWVQDFFSFYFCNFLVHKIIMCSLKQLSIRSTNPPLLFFTVLLNLKSED